MFRQGRPRAHIHNLRLASMLSFVAGMVNITGVLSIHTLTTNVTGHFAFFAADLIKSDYKRALDYVLYILFFLMGAFVCGFVVELILRKRPNTSHAIPMILEMIILIVVASTADNIELGNQRIACALLFAMGLQNALVTRISQATVRTTHLTGLFTDLGIEISQLLFYRGRTESKKLSKSIYLRAAIITFFFSGGVLGGFLYTEFKLEVLLFAAASLLVALLYDNIRLSFRHIVRKLPASTALREKS